jgi:hypothetical protein
MLFAHMTPVSSNAILSPVSCASHVTLPNQAIQNHSVKLNFKLTAVLVVP